MYKRLKIVAILVMLLLSFTISSVNPAIAENVGASQSRFHPEFRTAGYVVPGLDEAETGGFFLSLPGQDNTTFVIDMTSIGFEETDANHYCVFSAFDGQFLATQSPVPLDENCIKTYKSHRALVGDIVVYSNGVPTPGKFPVRWEPKFGHGPKPVEYVANMQIDPARFGYNGESGNIQLQSTIVLDETALEESLTARAVYTENITAGTDRWHTVDVSAAIKSMTVDVKWANNDSHLRLLLYAPDGKVLGPYTDSSDGTTDGEICLNISSSGSLATGEWYLKVTDTDDLGYTDYYVKTSL